MCVRLHLAWMAPSHRESTVTALLSKQRGTFGWPRLCAVGFEGGYSWNVSGSPVGWLASGPSQDLLHKVFSKRISLVTRIGCRHSLEGQRLSSLCISQQVATKGIITPTQMACQALGENSHSFDFFEKNKSTFPLVVDAYSRWLEMIPMTSTISLKTTEVLPSLFARYGLQRKLSLIMGLS